MYYHSTNDTIPNNIEMLLYAVMYFNEMANAIKLTSSTPVTCNKITNLSAVVSTVVKYCHKNIVNKLINLDLQLSAYSNSSWY